MAGRWMLVAAGLALGAVVARGAEGPADWPQWRGAGRDAHTRIDPPKTWPKELTQKWKVTVGDGVATPALVGDRLYVFTRQSGQEILRGLDAATGKELWQDKYDARPPSGAASGFAGPRASPAVAGGKVVTFGAAGTLSCLDAASGKVLWRKDNPGGSVPRFFTSSSPMIADGLAIVQLGGEDKGSIVAYDLATGDEKWKWAGDGTAYASPVLDSAAGTRQVVALTANNVVGLAVAGGQLLWKVPFTNPGRMAYNAATPVLEGSAVLFSGTNRGTHAVGLEMHDGKLGTKELWNNKDLSVQFNTPVVKGGLVYGISGRNDLFCLDGKTGKTAWTTSLGGSGGAGGGRPGGGGGKPGGGRPGMGGGGGGYGSVVDAGPVLLALTPAGKLVVFEPGDKEFKQLASYPVASGSTYAYPVAAGKRLYIKDKDAVTLWTLD